MRKLLVAAVIAAASVAPYSARATTQSLAHACGIFLAGPGTESCTFNVTGTSSLWDRGYGYGFSGTASITHQVPDGNGGYDTVTDWTATGFQGGGTCAACFNKGTWTGFADATTYTLTLTGQGGIVAGAWE